MRDFLLGSVLFFGVMAVVVIGATTVLVAMAWMGSLVRWLSP